MNKFKRRVVVVEHDVKFRELLSSMVEASGAYLLVNQYETCEEALRFLKKDLPDMVVMNLDFPQMKGSEAIEEFKRFFPQLSILVVTDYQNEETVFSALSAGASGYVLRDSWITNFVSYLNELSQGGAPLSPPIARLIIESMHISRISPLTHREGEVLKLITQGNSYSRIANELHISKETSKTHIRNIYRKLNVRTKSDVVRKAFEDRIVPVAWTHNYEAQAS
jgi:DNA-binding NarL/FixJ family response regulator